MFVRWTVKLSEPPMHAGLLPGAWRRVRVRPNALAREWIRFCCFQTLSDMPDGVCDDRDTSKLSPSDFFVFIPRPFFPLQNDRCVVGSSQQLPRPEGSELPSPFSEKVSRFYTLQEFAMILGSSNCSQQNI